MTKILIKDLEYIQLAITVSNQIDKSVEVIEEILSPLCDKILSIGDLDYISEIFKLIPECKYKQIMRTMLSNKNRRISDCDRVV